MIIATGNKAQIAGVPEISFFISKIQTVRIPNAINKPSSMIDKKIVPGFINIESFLEVMPQKVLLATCKLLMKQIDTNS